MGWKQLRLHAHDVDREWFALNSKNEHGWTYSKNCIFVLHYSCHHLENKICQNVVSFPPSFARTFSSREIRLGTRQRVHCFEPLRHISKTFNYAYTIFLRVLRIGSHIRSASWNIQHILWLICPCKRRDAGEIMISFQCSWTSVYCFLDSQIFLDIFLYYVDCGYNLEFW